MKSFVTCASRQIYVIIRVKTNMTRWAEYITHAREEEYMQVQRLLEISKRRLDDNIKVDLKEAGWGYGLNSFRSEYRSVVGCSELRNKFRVP
jgi:hypothetical protein